MRAHLLTVVNAGYQEPVEIYDREFLSVSCTEIAHNVIFQGREEGGRELRRGVVAGEGAQVEGLVEERQLLSLQGEGFTQNEEP